MESSGSPLMNAGDMSRQISSICSGVPPWRIIVSRFSAEGNSYPATFHDHSNPSAS